LIIRKTTQLAKDIQDRDYLGGKSQIIIGLGYLSQKKIDLGNVIPE
jgi:hypothetical protein